MCILFICHIAEHSAVLHAVPEEIVVNLIIESEYA